jgi:hypothetical protein
MIRSKWLATIAALSSGLVLIISAAGTAGRLSTSTGTFRQTYTALNFEREFFGSVRCPVTLEGSLHARTMSKVVETLIGYITSARVFEAACVGGRAGFKTETLPWTIRYNSFTGTLPNISSVKRVALWGKINLPIEGAECFYTANDPVQRRWVSIELIEEARGAITQVRFSANVDPEPTNRFPCPAAVRLEGQGTETVLGSPTRITLTLI